MRTKPAATRVGWIGTGVMGSSMCGHLLTAGYGVTIHTRTRSKAQPLLDRGAQWAVSPRAVAAESDILFTMVGFPQDVHTVYFDETGIMAGAHAGVILIDMTTTQPSLSREIAAAASAKDLSAIDAPVSGGEVGAKNAVLSIMIDPPLWPPPGWSVRLIGDREVALRESLEFARHHLAGSPRRTHSRIPADAI
jgi:3-hydroxyisobutyrate dehydrogenase